MACHRVVLRRIALHGIAIHIGTVKQADIARSTREGETQRGDDEPHYSVSCYNALKQLPRPSAQKRNLSVDTY